jgi:hypothetical protein
VRRSGLSSVRTWLSNKAELLVTMTLRDVEGAILV